MGALSRIIVYSWLSFYYLSISKCTIVNHLKLSLFQPQVGLTNLIAISQLSLAKNCFFYGPLCIKIVCVACEGMGADQLVHQHIFVHCLHVDIDILNVLA